MLQTWVGFSDFEKGTTEITFFKASPQICLKGSGISQFNKMGNLDTIVLLWVAHEQDRHRPCLIDTLHTVTKQS
jgi:hypothetical protein